MQRINILPSLLSARIAAGEVIERPASVLRELLDNALDAGADDIAVTIENGGIDRLTVADNGSGIARADLYNIAKRHATSKLSTDDDLYRISTLGFRGEALYSIAAVSKLTISTCSSETGERSTLSINNGLRSEITSQGPDRGTVMTSEHLFEDIPARRSFLKRASTEGMQCRNLLVSKALAFPSVRFTFTQDGTMRLSWPKCGTLKERVMMLYEESYLASADVESLHADYPDFSLDIIAANQSAKRSDRKEIRIYVNKRPVDEFSLVQAVTYGYGELLPGGSFPYCAVFVQDKPELADFNIHPAKKEVKLRNGAEIHHAVTMLIKNGINRVIPEVNLHEAEYKDLFGSEPEKAPPKPQQPFRYPAPERRGGSCFSEKPQYSETDKAWLSKALELKRKREEAHTEPVKPLKEEPQLRYIGQAFRLFLICEKDGDLWFIDQHAAHERILYDELLEQRNVQKLLVPLRIEADSETDAFLSEHSQVYTKLGIMLSRRDDGVWEVTSLPAACRQIEPQIAEFISTCRLDEAEMESELFAIIACKHAIKAGDEIDRWSAEDLIRKVFALKEPACPHGRTFMAKISEKELRQLVGRTK